MTMGYPGAGAGAGGVPGDIFDRIVAAQATNSGNWMRDGSYLLSIVECKYEQKYGGLTWITEFVVVTSEIMPGMFELGGEPVAAGTPGAVQVMPNAPGEKVSFVASVGNVGTPNAAGNVKAFLLVLSNENEANFNKNEQDVRNKRILEQAQGLPQESWTKSPFAESCKFLISPGQPMRGALIRAKTSRSVNQGRTNPANKGKLLVKPSWLHVPHKQDEILARRALIEQGLPIPWPMPTAS